MEFFMNIGVPKEIKNNENRVGLVPGGVKQLVLDGHNVFIETGAGAGIQISDQSFIEAGGQIVSNAIELYDSAELIIKVKEPTLSEIKLLGAHHILYAYLHLAADPEQTTQLLRSGATAIAYETIQLPDGTLPLLTPMSEVAGRMSIQVGATYLQNDHGGKGILLGGVPGTKRAQVTVIGCGIAGTNAIKMAMGMGADVTGIDLSVKKLADLEDLFENKITTLYSNLENIETSVIRSDLVIGAVLIPGAKAPRLVKRSMIAKMEKRSVVVDIAVDQGGCIETCRPTTHENPTFLVDDVIHYCVSNMPGAVAKTSTFALTNITLEYARKIAGLGLRRAIQENESLNKGVNVYRGNIVYKQIAVDLGLPYTPLRL